MILDRIMADSIRGLAVRKRSLPLEELKEAVLRQAPPVDFATALCGDGVQLIAEVKKASPSRGIIRPDFNPVEIARIYADNGASAISVLTEGHYFQGSLDYLKGIKDMPAKRELPLLRKDFLSDPYQIYESRACGADAILLIAAVLEPPGLEELLHLSHHLGMFCLVEVHNEAELEMALGSGARIIGINNRDLADFTVDLRTTERLRPLIPRDRIVVSESGIKNRDDIEQLEQWGVDAVLVGEALVSAPDIAARMRELL
jgi:indole-3-glycerol phosphate synthase